MIQEKRPSPTSILQHASVPLPWVSLLGLDGSGKSTVLAVLQDMLAPLRIHVLHRRPGIVYRTGQQSGNGKQTGIAHYGKPPHGQAKSLLKLMVMVADWQIGYWRSIRPARQHGDLVMTDRHALLDLIADPLRYRFGGPVGLIFPAVRLTPMPALVFLLDAPISVLQTRKQELSLEKAQELRNAYLELMQTVPNGRIIDASQPVEQVALDIISHLASLVE
jgi:thymidylate kinase